MSGGRYTPPPDEPDGVTHTPQEVEDMETPRGKFDEWLAYWHWVVYGILILILCAGGLIARCQ